MKIQFYFRAKIIIYNINDVTAIHGTKIGLIYKLLTINNEYFQVIFLVHKMKHIINFLLNVDTIFKIKSKLILIIKIFYQISILTKLIQ